ncbi:double-strand break repair protein MRE11 isoform X2 [Cephus cinctus]|uniref:Double-strand break repair protein n=1 Tax=Cephus cinctus TaxID=211228 RepID=A0AAJ7FND3_CEPCN|nr:double-strand break repair protein MRE11 isoform X2 [Cephus cinctus]
MSENDSADDIMKERSDDDTFNILIATDCHLGYEESTKRAQEQDSIKTFEEILKHAKDNNVDFILLGGDLFHDTKPSQGTLLKAVELLRKYCLGSREPTFELLSDPEENFQYKTANFEDPNLNVSIPVFSIHGNHDDPSSGTIGSLDLLSTTGLVNYFGKWTDLTQVTMSPVILKKGSTHICLYGISYINDQRLSRLFRSYMVKVLFPSHLDIEQCFNMMVLHQNRVKRPNCPYIPEDRLPSCLNFILWGHEHECRINPEIIAETGYHICQPGSSVATSLCEAESVPKRIGILSVNGNDFKVEQIYLQTVRPFVFDNIVLRDVDIGEDYSKVMADRVMDYVDDYIEETMITKASKQLTGHPDQPTQPLIRLRVFYSSNEEIFNTVRLAQKYCDEVANPMDMIIFRKAPEKNIKRKCTDPFEDDDETNDLLAYDDNDKDWRKSVQGGILKYFESKENQDKLTVLSVTGLNKALSRFVEKNDSDAFKDIIHHQMSKTVEYLQTKPVDTPEKIKKEIKVFQKERRDREEEEALDADLMFESTQRKFETVDIEKNNAIVLSDDDAEHNHDDEATGKGNKTRKASTRGAVRGRGGGRGRGKNAERMKNPLDITITSPTSSSPKTARNVSSRKARGNIQQFCQPSTSLRHGNISEDTD